MTKHSYFSGIASQYKQKPQHPLHKPTIYFNTPWLNTISLTTTVTQQTLPPPPHTVTTTDIKTSMHHIDTSIVSMHLATRGNNKILHTHPPHISSSEEILPHITRRTNKLLKCGVCSSVTQHIDNDYQLAIRANSLTNDPVIVYVEMLVTG